MSRSLLFRMCVQPEGGEQNGTMSDAVLEGKTMELYVEKCSFI